MQKPLAAAVMVNLVPLVDAHLPTSTPHRSRMTRSGGLAPISLPLFQGVRLLGSAQFSLSDMIVLLCYEDDEHAPQPEGRERMSAFRGLRSSRNFSRELGRR
jgi:hypothetical protein